MDPKFWSDLGQLVKWMGILWLAYNGLVTLITFLFVLDLEGWKANLVATTIMAGVVITIGLVGLVFWYSLNGSAVVILFIVGFILCVWAYYKFGP